MGHNLRAEHKVPRDFGFPNPAISMSDGIIIENLVGVFCACYEPKGNMQDSSDFLFTHECSSHKGRNLSASELIRFNPKTSQSHPNIKDHLPITASRGARPPEPGLWNLVSGV